MLTQSSVHMELTWRLCVLEFNKICAGPICHSHQYNVGPTDMWAHMSFLFPSSSSSSLPLPSLSLPSLFVFVCRQRRALEGPSGRGGEREGRQQPSGGSAAAAV
uniref:Uncharacterized protein n=1 Tax=Oryza glumipatula TaxID=40148 RepID=A0A0D9YAP7_9ORYZ